MARVLLLNPPVRGRMVLRDFACGESTKADYYWAPIDLLVLSGVLAPRHDVEVLDAVVERLDSEAALARAEAARPDVVFTLTAVVTLEDDDRFLSRLKARTGARIYAMGDAPQFEAARTLARTSSFDGLVSNFADPSLERLADGDEEGVTSVVLRRGEGLEARPIRRLDPMRYALPLHERFPVDRYRMPFTRWERSTSILTAYGCPFPCTFCNSRVLPGQQRPLDDVIEELEAIAGLGISEVYVRDFTFGPTRRRGAELASRIARAELGLRWSAECRIEVLDEALLDRMAEAGCEVILVGIETGSSEVARALGKKLTAERTGRLLAHARSVGIRTCGHFVLGVPGETPDEARATIDYARRLSLDYASFNLYAARLGTTMRDELVAAGQVDAEDFGEQDVSAAAQAYASMEPAELRRLFRWAVLSFYLRPGQVGRLLSRTPWRTLARQGSGVLRLMVEAGV